MEKRPLAPPSPPPYQRGGFPAPQAVTILDPETGMIQVVAYEEEVKKGKVILTETQLIQMSPEANRLRKMNLPDLVIWLLNPENGQANGHRAYVLFHIAVGRMKQFAENLDERIPINLSMFKNDTFDHKFIVVQTFGTYLNALGSKLPSVAHSMPQIQQLLAVHFAAYNHIAATPSHQLNNEASQMSQMSDVTGATLSFNTPLSKMVNGTVASPGTFPLQGLTPGTPPSCAGGLSVGSPPSLDFTPGKIEDKLEDADSGGSQVLV